MDQQYSSQPLLDLEIDPTVSRAFREATRWAKFIAITYTIILGIMLLVVVFAGARVAESFSTILEDAQSPFASIIGSALILILGVALAIGAVLLFFLFKFCSQVKDGLENQDQLLFNNGLKALRNYLMVYGIIALVYVVLLILGLILTLTLINS